MVSISIDYCSVDDSQLYYDSSIRIVVASLASTPMLAMLLLTLI